MKRYYSIFVHNQRSNITDKLKKEIEFIMIDSYSRFRFSKFYTDMLEEYVINDINKAKENNKEAYEKFEGFCGFFVDISNYNNAKEKKEKKENKAMRSSRTLITYFGTQNLGDEQDIKIVGEKNMQDLEYKRRATKLN
jgi:hypothetical protein